MEAAGKVKILSAGAITAKLRRMAYEIYERNFGQDAIVLVGIGPRGCYLADKLATYLGSISPLAIQRMDLEKTDKENGVSWADPSLAESLAEKTVLIVDDVLYSGKTMLAALSEIAGHGPSKIQVAVLIDRGHHLLPVKHDYVGMEIASSLKQYVSVEVDEALERAEAFIF
jgi:pyrimidine operon attenuation protein / uracil phosphoribosyltransferase